MFWTIEPDVWTAAYGPSVQMSIQTRDCSALTLRSTCSPWSKDCQCITVPDFCCGMRWNFWSSSWFGPTNSCGTQYHKPNSHTTSSYVLGHWLGGNRFREKRYYHSLTLPFWFSCLAGERQTVVVYSSLQAIECQYYAFNYCCTNFSWTGNSNSESIPLVDGNPRCKKRFFMIPHR